MRTALVTGGNRGIGLEICRQLDQAGFTVIMGSRVLQKGLDAARLISDGVVVSQLDVTDEESMQNLFKSTEARFGKLDVLINNAGVGSNYTGNGQAFMDRLKNSRNPAFHNLLKMARTIKPVLQHTGMVPGRKSAANISLMNARLIMETNFYGPWRMIQIFLPLLQKSDDPRIINMSSGLGELSGLTGEYPAYSLSKSSLNALTIMFSNELKEQGIKVNAMCPGWVKTDMGGPDAPRSVSQGADTAVWLATEKEITSGRFFRDRKEINW